VGATLAHKAQEGLHAQGLHLARDPFGGQRQGIEQVRQAHQVMVAFHGIPGVREGMLVTVALALLNLHAHFNPPALARGEVAAPMDIITPQRVAGDPHVASAFGDPFAAVGIDLLPGLFAADHMNEQALAVVSVAIGNVVDPPKVLLPAAPGLALTVVGLTWLQRLDLFPDRG
jgi:hypothetical protein